jgi:hypothetical protein
MVAVEEVKDVLKEEDLHLGRRLWCVRTRLNLGPWIVGTR